MGRNDPEKLVRAVGERVRELRQARGWTQNDLAMRLRAAVQRVQNIERGGENLTIFSLARLAEAFDVLVSELFERPSPTGSRRLGRPPKRATAPEDSWAARALSLARMIAPGKRGMVLALLETAADESRRTRPPVKRTPAKKTVRGAARARKKGRGARRRA